MTLTSAEEEHAAYIHICALWYARGALESEPNKPWATDVAKEFAEFAHTQARRYHQVHTPLDTIENMWITYRRRWIIS